MRAHRFLPAQCRSLSPPDPHQRASISSDTPCCRPRSSAPPPTFTPPPSTTARPTRPHTPRTRDPTVSDGPPASEPTQPSTQQAPPASTRRHPAPLCLSSSPKASQIAIRAPLPCAAAPRPPTAHACYIRRMHPHMLGHAHAALSTASQPQPELHSAEQHGSQDGFSAPHIQPPHIHRARSRPPASLQPTTCLHDATGARQPRNLVPTITDTIVSSGSYARIAL